MSPSTASAPSTKTPDSEVRRSVSDQKIGESKVATRSGAAENVQPAGAKPADPDLRRRLCNDGPCKEPPVKSGPESDLSRRVCTTGNCVCPAGQSAAKTGCVTSSQAVAQNQQQCAPGVQWNGTSCVNANRDCAGFIGQAANLANELRSIKAEIQMACQNDPSGIDCSNAKLRQQQARLRYQSLLTSAPLNCHALMPDELSLL